VALGACELIEETVKTVDARFVTFVAPRCPESVRGEKEVLMRPRRISSRIAPHEPHVHGQRLASGTPALFFLCE
jgi:hypothetical protein